MADAATDAARVAAILGNVPDVDTLNRANGGAYSLESQQALAQLACTGTIGQIFYATGKQQLEQVLELAQQCDSIFLGKLALYARNSAYMKDMPALLCAVLAARGAGKEGRASDAGKEGCPDKAGEGLAVVVDTCDPAGLAETHARQVLASVFPRVIDSAKMLGNFVQIVRSGQTGRKSFGTAVRRLIRQWFDAQTDDQLLWGSAGNTPSLGSIIRLTHPTPKDASRKAMHGWLLGHDTKQDPGKEKAYRAQDLPAKVRAYEAFKQACLGQVTKDAVTGAVSVSAPKVPLDADGAPHVPHVPFQMLASCGLDSAGWKAVARNAAWQMTRMNLNTFARHGVFKNAEGDADIEMIGLVSARLRDPEQIAKAKVFPYQLLAAFLNAEEAVPEAVKLALQDAMELATRNVPALPEGTGVHVFVDVSGSMSYSVTGQHGSRQASSVTCTQVAALAASAILRRNQHAQVLAFADRVVPCKLNPRDSVMTNARILGSLPSGGTNCSAPLSKLNEDKAKGDLVIYLSDNESWVDWAPGERRFYGVHPKHTAVIQQWAAYKQRNPKAKLVCIDLTPNTTTQATGKDVLNIGGFSDSVFNVIASFASGGTAEGWIDRIEEETL